MGSCARNVKYDLETTWALAALLTEFAPEPFRVLFKEAYQRTQRLFPTAFGLTLDTSSPRFRFSLGDVRLIAFVQDESDH